jgi:YVTN family beta-propeller protein
MRYKKIGFVFILFCLVIALGCKKKTNEQNEIKNLNTGILVLNEGLFNQNNASLTWYDDKTGEINQDVFLSNNQRGLGDTGNDMIRYGAKIYIVVNVSSTVEILDATTLKSIKQIQMLANGKAKQPRNIVAFGSNVYVSNFDGYVDVIDTVTLTITTRLKVGENPENLCVFNNLLFVSNSGGLNPPKMDSTISVIDLNSNKEIKKIVVGMNPGNIIQGLNNTLYVSTRGNYNDVKSTWKLVNANTGEIIKTFQESVISMELFQDSLILMNVDNQHLNVFSMKTNTINQSNFIALSSFVNPYNIQYLKNRKEICITDANGYVNQGYVSVYDENGKFQYRFKSGLNPSKIISYE